jgi:hypothetical protein
MAASIDIKKPRLFTKKLVRKNSFDALNMEPEPEPELAKSWNRNRNRNRNK